MLKIVDMPNRKLKVDFTSNNEATISFEKIALDKNAS